MSYGRIHHTTILVAGLVVLLCLVSIGSAETEHVPPNMCKTTDGRVCDRKIVIGDDVVVKYIIFFGSTILLAALFTLWCISGCQFVVVDRRRRGPPVFVY